MRILNETRADQTLHCSSVLVCCSRVQVMSLFIWLLWTLFRVTLGGPVQRVAWSEGQDPAEAEEDGALRPSFYRLPVFQHAPGSLVARELFRPVPYERTLPVGLTLLLFPPTKPQRSIPGPGGRAVEVRCSTDDISVRVDRLQLRAWASPSLFRLGSCQASRISPRFLFFHYRLTECDGQAKVVGGQLVYNVSLRYTPPPQGSVIRVLPLDLPICCQYNRFHYSYQVGFKPQVQHRTFVKSMKSKLSFSLSVCNGQWEPLPPGHGFSLGEPVYFVAQTGALLAGERLYIDSCYATSSKDPNGSPKVDIITNYGCMTDSRREGSSSRFLPAGGSVLKFSVDAFLFRPVSQVLYLHCSMSVGLNTPYTSKSCNYNKTAYRWEELEGLHSVCSCCDFMCTGKQDSIKNTVSSPGWFIVQKAEEKPKMRAGSFQSKEERIDVHLENVQTFPQQMEKRNNEGKQGAIPVIPEKTFVPPARKKESVSHQGKKEEKEDDTREVVVEKAENQLTDLETDGIFMSDQTRPEEDETVRTREEVPSTKSGSVRANGLMRTNGSRAASGATTTTATTIPSFGIDSDNASINGSIENVSTTDSAKMSSNTTNLTIEHARSSSSSAGYDTMNTDIGEESFFNLTATSSASSSDSVWDSGINEHLLTNRRETLAWTRSASSDFEMDPHGFLDFRKSESRKQESDVLDTLWSEQFTSVNKSLSDRLQGRSGDSGNGKGSHGKDDMLYRLQIRGLKSGESAHLAVLKDPDFDSGIEEGETLHLSQLTKEEFSAAIPKLQSISSGSVISEQVHEDSPSHSAATVTTTLQDSESSHMSNREWAEMLPEWSLQTLTEMEELRQDDDDMTSIKIR